MFLEPNKKVSSPLFFFFRLSFLRDLPCYVENATRRRSVTRFLLRDISRLDRKDILLKRSRADRVAIRSKTAIS